MASNDGENRGAAQDRGEIRDQLDRILNSPEFQAPDRGRRFLKYVVEEALEGRSEQLNAHTIAEVVFGRGAGFDAQSDPVVRIEAGRIRRALERYYLVCGRDDPVRITIPKGHYIPSFEQCGDGADASSSASQSKKMGQSGRQDERKLTYRDLLVPVGVPAVFAAIAMLAMIRPLEHYLKPAPVPPLASEVKPHTKIAVEPLVVLGGNPGTADIARGLGDQLISRLTKLDGIIVLAPVLAASSPPAGSTWNLQGNIAFEKNSLRVQVRLIRSVDGSVVWAKRFDHQPEGRNVLDLEDEIGAQIVRDISTIDEIKSGSAKR
ncbi:hypothetical protein [Rhizobium sp. 18055]|uniref:hypothetical protein n=1 Tax=Rhizobium sp. 18055 TaxID=2681403 RepID=UPI001359E8B7|nr:hypothetical protein [Rhizobium sp. 18055]